jgi:hypothetical protein
MQLNIVRWCMQILALFCRLLTGRDGARFQVGVSGTRLRPGNATSGGTEVILLLHPLTAGC